MVTGEPFGRLVRRYRRNAELTQESLAERAGLSVRAVRDIESGTRHRPRQDTVHLLLDALAVPPDERADFLRAAGWPPADDEALDTLRDVLPAHPTQLLAILIADMRGYTAYTVEHGDEAGAQVAERFAASTRATVERFGGSVLELRGDEALCTFASARQAVRAALALQDRYRRESKEGRLPLGVGIGLDAGEVVAVEGGYRGQSLNLAARLCSLAKSGDVLMSEGLVHLARKIDGLVYIERGYEQLKGIAEPVRVIGAAPEGDPAAHAATQAEDATRLPVGNFLGAVPAGKLVGRDEELGAVAEALDGAAVGEGRLLTVAGERGIGKTRLAQEISIQARARGFLVASGRCYESQADLPYYPFLEALSHLLHGAPPPLRAAAGKRWPYLARLLPEELSAVPTPAADPREELARLYRAVTGFVRACSERSPVALLFDDLQWADEASLDLFAHLARNTRADAVLLVGTYRDDAVSADSRLGSLLRALGRERLLERLTLRRLSSEGTAQLVSSLMGETAASPELVDLVQRRTRGRPFFIEEMVRALGGRYQLVSELGAGGMGRVFQAVDTRDDSPVAVKILFASSEAGIDALLRFQQEGAVLSTLKHPNIVEVRGAFLEEHISFIIMELLDGVSLAEMLRLQRPDLARTRHILAQVAAALAYAHGRNIVHRDIKPDNIMVLAGDQVKVTDFGIARVAGTGATLNTVTGMGVGTPLYMAPEQIEGSNIDGRADIYSLGAVLYEMVTGKPPFEGADPITIGFKHLKEAPQPPTEIAVTLPPDWEDLILSMLAKNPDDRPQTAGELEAAIEALSTEPVTPGSRSLLGRVRTPTPRPVRREKPPTPQPARARTPPPTPGAPARRPAAFGVGARAGWAIGALAVALLLSVGVTIALRAFSTGRTSASASAPLGLVPDPAWSNGTKANTTDTSLSSTPSGVTVSNAFPDGKTSARCFIQVTGASGAQHHAFGNCAGISLDVTCASASYDLSGSAPSGKGASLSINGRPTWTGAIPSDSATLLSPNCANMPGNKLSTLAAHLSGTIAGQDVVWLIGSDNSGPSNPANTQRDGCFVYTEPAEASAPHCVRTDLAKKLGSFYDEVTAKGPSGDIVETASGPGNTVDGNVTLQGVFLETSRRVPRFADELKSPVGVATDASGDVYVADSGDNLVEELSPTGTPVASWSGARGKAFSNPQAVAVDARGNIYVADENNNRVVKLSPSGRSIAPWGSGDSGASSLNAPLALALDGDGNLWVLDAGTPPLHELSPEGKLLTQVRLQGMESTVYYAIAPDGHGHMYVIPGEAAGVAVYSISALSGTYANVPGSTFGPFGGGRGRLRQPGAIALDRQGDAFIADTGNDRIAAFSPSGAWLFAVGRKGTGAAEFDAPGGIAVDQQGNVYVADTNNNRLQRLVPRGATR